MLEDETTRCILTNVHREPQSAQRLSEHCGASKPTVYRRLEEMRSCDLLVETTRLDTEAGHHHTVYATDLDRIVVEMAREGFEFEFHFREAMADRLTRLIEDI